MNAKTGKWEGGLIHVRSLTNDPAQQLILTIKGFFYYSWFFYLSRTSEPTSRTKMPLVDKLEKVLNNPLLSGAPLRCALLARRALSTGRQLLHPSVLHTSQSGRLIRLPKGIKLYGTWHQLLQALNILLTSNKYGGASQRIENPCQSTRCLRKIPEAVVLASKDFAPT